MLLSMECVQRHDLDHHHDSTPPITTGGAGTAMNFNGILQYDRSVTPAVPLPRGTANHCSFRRGKAEVGGMVDSGAAEVLS